MHSHVQDGKSMVETHSGLGNVQLVPKSWQDEPDPLASQNA